MSSKIFHSDGTIVDTMGLGKTILVSLISNLVIVQSSSEEVHKSAMIISFDSAVGNASITDHHRIVLSLWGGFFEHT